MKAVLMTEVGGPEVLHLQDMAEPEITNPAQVKIRLKAAGINPIDTKVRGNGLFYPDALPAVLGCDGAGTIVAIGDEVTGFKPGDEVWFCNGGLGKEQGNYAEYTVIDNRWLALKPKTASFTEAAALPLVLITAWGALFERGGLQSGQTVLIHAGAGGVGHVAIQLAKQKGARVITTVSSEEKADFVRRLGADDVIFYRHEDLLERVNSLTEGRGADLVFDTVGPEAFKASIEATAHFGSIVTLLDPGAISLAEARMRNLKIGFELMLTPMLRGLDDARNKQVDILKRCAEWFDQGVLQVNVSHLLRLEQASEAHDLIGAGHMTGKIVLEI
ncbi:MAG: zinc-dependent alcohol dehydrogenase family protein [Methylobacter sp.]|uniref:zinc-dependent alcohol dehydrogenase family protein n=1 Tax=Methylobacter sp. TaxID=2051955 RepID=UPI00258A8E31|nr:zinc-dependent alcohol dehydrogenase family protein [Methylobacter sp.]MCL7419295.1 zinc-dependent alcohol dehydrogenase family protein [Methylobacter sp.]